MIKHWKTYKLSEIAESISRGISPKYTEQKGTLVINQRCIRDNKILYENSRLHDHEVKSIAIGKILKKYDILINSTGVGTLGRVAQFKKFRENVTVDSHVTILRPKNDFAGEFIGYALINVENKIEALAEGSTGQTELSRKRLGEEIAISIPDSKEEQRAIASILSALDDKIELNLQMNRTLEEMAMALYKHWFVDFGPFKDGKFVESELGMIPEGWEVKRFFDLFEILSGGTPKTSVEEYWNGDICWASAKDIGNGSVFIDSTEKQITNLGIEKSATKILPEDTVIVVARGSVGKFGMIAKPMTMNQSCYGIFSKSAYTQPLVYLMTSVLISHFQNVAYGSVFDTITTSTFQSINVLLPDAKTIKLISSKIEPLFEKIKHNTLENSILQKQRDSLLPKLISGDIQLSETLIQ